MYKSGETWVHDETKFHCSLQDNQHLIEAIACVFKDGTEIKANANGQWKGKWYSCGYSESSEESDRLVLKEVSCKRVLDFRIRSETDRF